MSSLDLEDFITSVDTSYQNLPNIHQPGQFDVCLGESSNRHFQWKLMTCTLKVVYFLCHCKYHHQFKHSDSCSHILFPVQILVQCNLIYSFYASQFNFIVISYICKHLLLVNDHLGLLVPVYQLYIITRPFMTTHHIIL